MIEISSFSIQNKSFVVIKGENGTGKTLILSHILGLENELFGKGEVFVRHDANKTAFLTYPTLLVKGSFQENLLGSNYDKKIKDLLNFDFCEKEITLNPINISYEQQQKLNLLRVLSQESNHLILDEPSSNLDTSTQNNLLCYISGIKGTKTIIIISHDNLFEDLADEIIGIESRKLVYIKYRTP